MQRPLAGVLAAAPTPFSPRGELDCAAVGPLLDSLAQLGCHGVLLAGTTGEGPSLAVDERRALFEAAAGWRAASGREEFILLGGTGCPDLPTTIVSTMAAAAAGLDAALVAPPYFYKGVTPAGLRAWYLGLLDALPNGARIMLYHIPSVTAVPVPIETIAALVAAHPGRCVGLKDSGADLLHTRALVAAFPDLAIFTGTDTHLLPLLRSGGAGSITALATVAADRLRLIHAGRASRAADAARADVDVAQAEVEALRAACERLPLVPVVKALAAELRGLPAWPVRPPLVDLGEDERRVVVGAARGAIPPAGLGGGLSPSSKTSTPISPASKPVATRPVQSSKV